MKSFFGTISFLSAFNLKALFHNTRGHVLDPIQFFSLFSPLKHPALNNMVCYHLFVFNVSKWSITSTQASCLSSHLLVIFAEVSDCPASGKTLLPMHLWNIKWLKNPLFVSSGLLKLETIIWCGLDQLDIYLSLQSLVYKNSQSLSSQSWTRTSSLTVCTWTLCFCWSIWAGTQNPQEALWCRLGNTSSSKQGRKRALVALYMFPLLEQTPESLGLEPHRNLAVWRLALRRVLRSPPWSL